MFDIVVSGGFVADGTGAPGRTPDIGVKRRPGRRKSFEPTPSEGEWYAWDPTGAKAPSVVGGG